MRPAQRVDTEAHALSECGQKQRGCGTNQIEFLNIGIKLVIFIQVGGTQARASLSTICFGLRDSLGQWTSLAPIDAPPPARPMCKQYSSRKYVAIASADDR